MHSGEIVKAIKEEKGLSRNEIVRRSPYWSYEAWARLERGERRLAVEEVPSVAIALDMDAVELFLLLTKKGKV